MAAQPRTHRADALVARLADAQHGVVARRQLAAHGIERGWIAGRVERRLLVRLHRGVYAVGHRRLHRDGLRMAAVLAAGPDAVLSHRDAAALHALLPAGDGVRIEVSTPRAARSTATVRVHGRRLLAAADVTVVGAIPVTTVARTLVDVADVVPEPTLARSLATAERLRVVDLGELAAARARVRTRRGRGHARLTAVLAAHARHGAQLTRSDLEQRFLALVAAAGLPAPGTNVWIEEVEVDAVWRRERVAVELDGWAFHGDRIAFRRDRAKGNRLALAGWQLLRYTHGDVVIDGARVVRELRAALGG